MTRVSREQSVKTSQTTSKQTKDILMLKIVIRCLPPTLTEEEFVKLIEPISEHDFFCFVRADSSLEQYACSRAYLNFTNQNDVVAFRDKWDGFPFKDTNGREYPAVVELAPYQKIPKKAIRKPDTRCGTIEEDEDYQEFLEVLNAEVEPLPSAEAYLEELEERQRAAATARVTTPLIDFLKRKRIERIKVRERVREERRLKEKERKRQREEEKRKLDKERKRKREERERREKETRATKKEEKSSDIEEKKTEEKKVDEKTKEPVKKDTPIKLLKKTDTKSDTDAKAKDTTKGGSKDTDRPRTKPEADRKVTESGRSADTPIKGKAPSAATSARNASTTPTAIAEKRKPPGRDGRDDRDAREGKPERIGKDLKEGRDGRDGTHGRDGRDARGGRDSRDGRGERDGDRYRGDRGGRDRYTSDRRPPLKTSSQESLSKTGRMSARDNKAEHRDSPRSEVVRDRDGRRPPPPTSNRERGETRDRGYTSRDGYKDRPRDREERRGGAGGREERLVGKGDSRTADRNNSSSRNIPGTKEKPSRETEKEEDAKREERKTRNKDRRPDMVRYQPGQRSWRATKKEEGGSDSSRASPTSSEGDKPKPEEKKNPVGSAVTPAASSPVVAKKVEEKRPTAAKKFDSQVRGNPGRSSGGSRDENRGRSDPRPGERTPRGVGRGYREERSYRNRQRQGDVRKKSDETGGGGGGSKGPQSEAERKK